MKRLPSVVIEHIIDFIPLEIEGFCMELLKKDVLLELTRQDAGEEIDQVKSLTMDILLNLGTETCYFTWSNPLILNYLADRFPSMLPIGYVLNNLSKQAISFFKKHFTEESLIASIILDREYFSIDPSKEAINYFREWKYKTDYFLSILENKKDWHISCPRVFDSPFTFVNKLTPAVKAALYQIYYTPGRVSEFIRKYEVTAANFDISDIMLKKTKELIDYGSYYNYGKDFRYLYHILDEILPYEPSPRISISMGIIALDYHLLPLLENRKFLLEYYYLEMNDHPGVVEYVKDLPLQSMRDCKPAVEILIQNNMKLGKNHSYNPHPAAVAYFIKNPEEIVWTEFVKNINEDAIEYIRLNISNLDDLFAIEASKTHDIFHDSEDTKEDMQDSIKQAWNELIINQAAIYILIENPRILSKGTKGMICNNPLCMLFFAKYEGDVEDFYSPNRVIEGGNFISYDRIKDLKFRREVRKILSEI